MATYDYKCTACGDIHEEKHSMLQEPEILCPKCEQPCEKHIAQVHIDKYFEGNVWEDTKYRK